MSCTAGFLHPFIPSRESAITTRNVGEITEGKHLVNHVQIFYDHASIKVLPAWLDPGNAMVTAELGRVLRMDESPQEAKPHALTETLRARSQVALGS